jgi:rhamnogalacturonan endolyase
LVLSDGRPAAHAAVFVGDNHPNRSTLDQGAWYYYRSYADKNGNFSIANVRSGKWNLQAWSNGSDIGNVTTVYSQNDVEIKPAQTTDLGNLVWKTQDRKQLWQIGVVDRRSTGFNLSGAPHEHARHIKCPANLEFRIGKSKQGDWCIAQGAPGTWSVLFSSPRDRVQPSASMTLSIALAGYSAGITATVNLNGMAIGQLNQQTIGRGDPALYRSGTLAGEWHLVEFNVPAGVLHQKANSSGENRLDISIASGAKVPNQPWKPADAKISPTTSLRGFMYDSIMLETKA